MFVGFNSLVVLLLVEAGIAEVVVGVGKALLVLVMIQSADCCNELISGILIFLLLEKCVSEVVVRLKGAAVFLQSAAVVYFGFCRFVFAVLPVAVADVAVLFLGKAYLRGEQRYDY